MHPVVSRVNLGLKWQPRASKKSRDRAKRTTGRFTYSNVVMAPLSDTIRSTASPLAVHAQQTSAMPHRSGNLPHHAQRVASLRNLRYTAPTGIDGDKYVRRLAGRANPVW
jgi:hypothetical protein